MIAVSVADTVETLKIALFDMASAFDVSEKTLQEAESRESLGLFKSYSGATFAAVFPSSRVNEWFTRFGDDLSLRIRIVDSGDTLEVGPNSGHSHLDQLYHTIKATEIDHIEVRAELTKRQLIRVLNHEVGTSFSALYFFGTTLESRLTIDRLQALFESGVFSQEDHTVVGVLFEHGLIWSNYMTVVGLLKYDSDHFVQVSAPTRYRTKWNQVRLMRSASAVWPDALGAVDPHSMQVRTSEPGLEHIRERLLGLSEVLSLMQFCVSVLSQHDGTITAQVSRPGGAMLSFAPDSAYIPPHTFSDALLGTPAFQLFKWAFRGEDYDKIDLVRDLIDREVRGRDDDPVTHLLLCAPELLTSARAGYKALRVRALESYWKARQEAKEKVDAFVATTRSNVDKLRADMLGRVIQFFTAIVAFLAVGVLQPKLSSWIKSSGLIFSIIYILLIGGFQLLPAWLDYKQLLFEARDAVDAYNVLSPNERENLKSRLRNGWQSDFVKWLTACVAVYAAAAVTFTVLLVALLTSY